MALKPGVNIPSTISGTGNNKRDNGLFSNHLFDVGLEKPQILDTLLLKFPKSYLLSLTERIKAKRDLYNETYTWPMMDRTRSSATVSSVTGNTTASAVITTDVAYSSANAAGYWLPGDTFYIPDSGARGVVTAVGDSSGFQTITVARPDGSNWSTALLAATMKLGHTGTSFGQGSTGSGGFRSYFPTSEYNVTTIQRRGIKISRNAMRDKTILDANGTWTHYLEDIEHKNMLRDVEATSIFGTRHKNSSIGGRNQSRGLLEYAEGSGQTVTFSGAAGCQEADLKQLIEALVPQEGSDDIILLTGVKLQSDIQSALGNNYREIPTNDQPRELAGLNFQSYFFLDKKIHFKYYDLFSDTTVVPHVAASSSAKDFRNFGIALDFGQVEGVAGGSVSNIEMGWLEPLFQKEVSGMASDGYKIADPFDGIQFEMLCEFMPICYRPERLGLLYSVG